MKKLTILGLLVLFAFVSNAQMNPEPHIFVQMNRTLMAGLQRTIYDVGLTVGHHSRLSVYTENFLTNRPAPRDYKQGDPTYNYRKFFLGARYSHIIAIKDLVDVVPSVGVDIRLNGELTKKTRNMGFQGTVSNMPSARLGVALEKPFSYNPKKVLSHIKLSVSATSQWNVNPNFGKTFRPGAGIGINVTI